MDPTTAVAANSIPLRRLVQTQRKRIPTAKKGVDRFHTLMADSLYAAPCDTNLIAINRIGPLFYLEHAACKGRLTPVQSDYGESGLSAASLLSFPPSPPAGRIASEAFRDCLPAAVGHTSARKEMRRQPPRLTEKTVSGVANWPSKRIRIFLDICVRSPDLACHEARIAATSRPSGEGSGPTLSERAEC